MGVPVLPVQSQQAPDSIFPIQPLRVRANQGDRNGEVHAVRLPLGSNNPFYSASGPVSPISPIEHHQRQVITSPRPSRPIEAERLAALRNLEGSSHMPSDTSRGRSRVVQDTNSKQDSPHRENPLAHTMILPRKVTPGPSEERLCCRTCGRRRTSANGEIGTLDDCSKCGKRKAIMSLESVNVFPTTQTRSASDNNIATMDAPVSVPSRSTNPAPPRSCCNKCGRKPRPGQVSASSRNFTAPAGSVTTAATSTEEPGHLTRLQKTLSFGIESIRPTHRALPKLQSGVCVEIDVTPPTASTYRAVNSPFPEDSPLINEPAKKAPKLSRSASIASAISRTFSRRKSKKGSSAVSPIDLVENPLPTQQVKQSPGNAKVHATSGNESQAYDRLGAANNKIDRPGSPFSFTDKPAEDEAFEMNDMRISKFISNTEHDHIQTPASTPMLIEQSMPLEPVQRPEHLRSKSAAVTSTLAVPSSQDDTFLAEPNQRPTITRFKSMRVGVGRAASVTRSTSIKRFNSIKKTPELWYRTDMSLEGAIGAY